ncbi:hypothetical protein JTE90_013797 [Oedothorax gibbosus]|uniref:Uncharacterized protein n=1 Tax=Oedothorax gibbosus TaxID=931172 RepID=A0AAV6VIF2_9ARAC|nr:hypothetical protein JTE90_013797 [Oedothorax gibbosus]
MFLALTLEEISSYVRRPLFTNVLAEPFLANSSAKSFRKRSQLLLKGHTMATFCDEVADALLRRVVVLLNDPQSSRETELLTLRLICVSEKLRKPWSDAKAFGDVAARTEIQDVNTKVMESHEHGDHPNNKEIIGDVNNEIEDVNYEFGDVNNNIEKAINEIKDVNKNIKDVSNEIGDVNTEIKYPIQNQQTTRQGRTCLQRIFQYDKTRDMQRSERHPKRSIWTRIKRRLTRPRPLRDQEHERSRSPRRTRSCWGMIPIGRRGRKRTRPATTDPERPRDHQNDLRPRPSRRTKTPERFQPQKRQTIKKAPDEETTQSTEWPDYQEGPKGMPELDHGRAGPSKKTHIPKRCKQQKGQTIQEDLEGQGTQTTKEPDHQEGPRPSRDTGHEIPSRKTTSCWAMFPRSRLGRRRTRHVST